MGSPMWSRPRVAVLAAAVVVSLLGGLIWAEVVGRETAADDEVTLDEPGEYVEPGAGTNPERSADRLPAIALVDAAGATFDPELDDRPMVVNIWFSTCPPCARELIEFGDLDREIGDRVRFVGIDPRDDAATMTEFASARDVDYELYLDEDGAIIDELRLVAFPVTLLVDPDGTIVAQEGTLTGAELRGLVAEHWGIT